MNLVEELRANDLVTSKSFQKFNIGDVDGKYKVRVYRVDDNGYGGMAIIFKDGFHPLYKVLDAFDVTLSFGWRFGPDTFDVNDILSEAVDRVDKYNKGQKKPR
jgi:hypothetical protein